MRLNEVEELIVIASLPGWMTFERAPAGRALGNGRVGDRSCFKTEFVWRARKLCQRVAWNEREDVRKEIVAGRGELSGHDDGCAYYDLLATSSSLHTSLAWWQLLRSHLAFANSCTYDDF